MQLMIPGETVDAALHLDRCHDLDELLWAGIKQKGDQIMDMKIRIEWDDKAIETGWNQVTPEEIIEIEDLLSNIGDLSHVKMDIEPGAKVFIGPEILKRCVAKMFTRIGEE